MSEVKMVRVEVSKDQWRDLRKVALDEDMPVQMLISVLIHDHLNRLGFEYTEVGEKVSSS